MQLCGLTWESAKTASPTTNFRSTSDEKPFSRAVMTDAQKDLTDRAAWYAESRDLELWERLGAGIDGTIWATSRKSAIKVFLRIAGYERERNAYFRLRQSGKIDIAGFTVPELVDWSDELRAVEMAIVEPPWVIDFAAAYLDEPADYPEEVLEESMSQKAELFGSHWPKVEEILYELRQIGIFYYDPSPNNIRFSEELD